MTTDQIRTACESLNPKGYDYLIDLRCQQINYLTKNFFPHNAEPTVSDLIHLLQLDINDLQILKNNKIQSIGNAVVPLP